MEKEKNEFEAEELEKDALFMHLYHLYNFPSKEEFAKSYKSIRLGYLLALLDNFEK